jgi:site-specific DNA recombinase
MIAAIYARKSTEQNISEDAKSVATQVTLARAFAAEMKWPVVEEYIDDAVSGADTAKLLNRARMIGDAAAGKFQVLVIRDLDRLSRDDREENVVYTLEDCGVEVWTYFDRARVDTSTALNRGMLSMKATFAAAEREAASKRTQEKMRLKVERGEAGAGRRVLGYRNVGEQGSRRREVDPAQAEIVRRIFRLAAEGKGLLKIAKTLSAEGVKNPTGQDRSTSEKRTDQWSSTGIREVLHRELYLGRVVYGRTTWKRRRDRETGLAKKVKVAASKAPVVREDPTLRIVPDELWAAARERMAATHAVYLRRMGGQLGGKPASGLESRYLLAGFLRCGVCGGNLIISKKTGKRG